MCLYMCRRIKFGSTIPVHLPPFRCLYLNGPIPYIADRSGCFPDPAHQHPMSPTNHGHTAYVACHHTLKCCICSRFLPPFCVDFSVSKGSTSRDLQSWAGSGIIAPTHVLSCSPARNEIPTIPIRCFASPFFRGIQISQSTVSTRR